MDPHRISFSRTADYDLLRDMDRRLMGSGIASIIVDDGHAWWIARAVSGRVAGYCALGVYQSEGGYGFLHRAAVEKPFRGQGLQRRMIFLRERAARAAGVKVMLTYTTDENLASANNLLACGYRLYRPADDFGGTGALYFRKRL